MSARTHALLRERSETVSAREEGSEVRLTELYSAEEVQRRIEELVDRLYRDYADCPVTFLVIAEGARRFAERLVEALQARKVTLDVVTLRARRTHGTELGEVEIEAVDPSCFEDRDVLVVDDIADEGRTLQAVLSLLEEGEPRSVRVAVLVSKHAGRKVAVPLDYVGFDVEDGWVVGFGMDLDGRFRELNYLALAEGSE
jgi:hypoxanthine phosphoribosyltransferase